MITKELGNRIKELRTAKGYSQESFAPICGLHRTYIAGVEAGRRNISIENLYKISSALEIPLDELFKFTSPVHKTILLKINGVCFILESDTELTPDLKDEIEIICKYAYDEEDSSVLRALEEMGSYSNGDNIFDIDVYTMAEAIKETIESSLDIKVSFKGIDLEAIVE